MIANKAIVKSVTRAAIFRIVISVVWSDGNLRTATGQSAGPGQVDQASAATSTMASAKARGASWGRLCPIPPLMVRCAYFPENILA